MVEVVGVRYRDAGHIYYFAPGDPECVYSDKVSVGSQQSLHIATAALPKKEIDPNDPPEAIRPISHEVSQVELEKDKKDKKDAYGVLKIAKEKVQLRKLKMKMVKAEYTFDRNKSIFSFTADGRIDFRGLIKDLAAVLCIRIELRRIGVRDETEIIGGVGPCGHPLCCSSFLGDFMSVSIEVVKDQSLSLDPTKVSGSRGCLICCLQYESEEYETAKKEPSDLGKVIAIPDDKGRVIGLNLLSRIVSIRPTGWEDPVEYEWDELKEFIQIGEMNG